MLTKEGATGHLMGFTRNNFPTSNDGLSVESLGTISHGNYFRRIMTMLRFVFLVRQRSRKFDVVYTFALDMLLISKIALLFKQKVRVYHIQDLRPVFFGNTVISKLARGLEKYLLSSVDFLVVSSKNFYDQYFRKIYGFPHSRVVVVENKMETDLRQEKIVDSLNEGQLITIGYFGVMRCTRSWDILKEFVEGSKQYVLYMKGKPVAVPDLANRVARLNNIIYEGVYRSPEDLPAIYNKVDIVWAAYPYSGASDGNWRYARTIRFYEACAFQKPVIVQKGTPQAEEVIKYDIGIVVDMTDIHEAVLSLRGITVETVNEWKKNVAALPQELYTHSNEYKDLLESLKNREKVKSA